MGDTDVLTYLEYCQLTGTDPAAAEADEVRVQMLITAVSEHLELACNCRFVQRTYMESHKPPPAGPPFPRLSLEVSPAPTTMVLHQRPVQAVLSIADMGSYVMSSTLYRLHPELALIECPTGWPPPDGAWLVTLVGGNFPDTAHVAMSVKEVAATLVKQRDAHPGEVAAAGAITSEQVGPVRVSYSDPSASMGGSLQQGAFAALPPSIQAVLLPYVCIGGLGW